MQENVRILHAPDGCVPVRFKSVDQDQAHHQRENVSPLLIGAGRQETGQTLDPLNSSFPEMQGTLLHIFISRGRDYWGSQGAGRLQHGIREVGEAECVAGRGLRGDRYFHSKPGHKGQVTFFEARVVDEIRKEFKLPKLPASVFRRNLIVTGVRLKEWLGRQFLFQGILFEGSQECKPCHWMSRVVNDGTEAFMKKEFRGGLRAKILTSGTLHTTHA